MITAAKRFEARLLRRFEASACRALERRQDLVERAVPTSSWSGLVFALKMLVRKLWKVARQWLWSIDALLFVLMYAVLLLLIPTPSPRWKTFARRDSRLVE